ncbi:MAG: NFACT RNA binding domain-containing protein [Treponema sp.]|jgi:predicted ribosome quality control (RQC) complex YloA/Tae2 family protein|nr:NFACT RNA binding domain-containing protein [Treponema sp.]
MSLNWNEINLILKELDLPGCQIQRAVQSSYDVLSFKLYNRQSVERPAKTLLICLAAGACRLHETFAAVPKSDKPLRFAEFLNSRIVNGYIEEAVQLGDNRIILLTVRRGEIKYRVYIRLWSNAANVIVTDESGAVLDVMKRHPKKGEHTGGHYEPAANNGSQDADTVFKEYPVRELDGEGSFNEKIDAWYSREGSALSLESLKEQAKRDFEGSIGRLKAALGRLKEKEADYAKADRLREYGDIILANIPFIKPGDEWLETENFYSSGEGGKSLRIKLDPKKTPAAAAEVYYEQYRRAKNGLEELQKETARGEKELTSLEETLVRLLDENNPLVLHKLLKSGGKPAPPTKKEDAKRPGLSFRRGDWLIIVGRDAKENDALLRKHVKGGDLWLHARDYPGSYVFIKQRKGKSFPLDILLDAGSLAIFYSKGRSNGEGDLFYTPVKYLRRAKDGPKGLVIPTQEKNLHVKVEEKRLEELESCRIEK